MGNRVEPAIGKGRSIVQYQIGSILLECSVTDSCISISNSCHVHDDSTKREVLADLLGLFPEFGKHRKQNGLLSFSPLAPWKRCCKARMQLKNISAVLE